MGRGGMDGLVFGGDEGVEGRASATVPGRFIIETAVASLSLFNSVGSLSLFRSIEQSAGRGVVLRLRIDVLSRRRRAWSCDGK